MDLSDTPIEVLGLSTRTYNALHGSGVVTVGQVLKMSADDLCGLRNFGQKARTKMTEWAEPPRDWGPSHRLQLVITTKFSVQLLPFHRI